MSIYIKFMWITKSRFPSRFASVQQRKVLSIWQRKNVNLINFTSNVDLQCVKHKNVSIEQFYLFHSTKFVSIINYAHKVDLLYVNHKSMNLEKWSPFDNAKKRFFECVIQIWICIVWNIKMWFRKTGRTLTA